MASGLSFEKDLYAKSHANDESCGNLPHCWGSGRATQLFLMELPSRRTSVRLRASLAALLGSALVVGSAGAGLDQAGQCVGDANGDGKVTADELVSAVNNS